MLPTLLLTIIIVGFVFVGVGLRILLVKNGEYRGSCATMNPYLQKEIGNCTVCGKTPEEDCKKGELSVN